MSFELLQLSSTMNFLNSFQSFGEMDFQCRDRMKSGWNIQK